METENHLQFYCLFCDHVLFPTNNPLKLNESLIDSTDLNDNSIIDDDENV